MSDIVNLVLAGLATGAIYALVAIGFTLLWRTSQTINFAQGEFVMLPAFFALAALNLHAPLWLALVVGLGAAMLVLGLLFKLAVVDPMLKHGVLPLAICTMALSIFLKEGVKQTYSAEAQAFPSFLPGGNVVVFGAQISVQSLSILVFAIVVVVALHGFLTQTSTGRQMQATAQNPGVARLLGIPIARMILYTFLINAALVGLASFLVSPVYLAKFSAGDTLGLSAFIAAIVGGFNQIPGAIAGGLLLGVLDNFAAAYVSTQYRGAVPLFLLVAVVLFRPQGLFGRAEERVV